MKHIVVEGKRLAYEEKGKGEHTILFLHGWTCNHSHFAAQMEAFSKNFRVVAPDLRGHGQSDKPRSDYTLERFTADICHLCEDLDLRKPLLVGHSMGGTIALETAARYPGLLSGIALIDSLLLPSADILGSLRGMYKSLLTDFSSAMDEVAVLLQMSSENADYRSVILQEMKSTPREVALSTFEHHVLAYDAASSIAACRVPACYIRSLSFMADLDRLKRIWPGILTAETLGSGHFSMLEVPDQINAMLHRFCSLLWSGRVATSLADGAAFNMR